MIDEKIDATAIRAMTDEHLASYLPSEGDRIALRSHLTQRPDVLERLRAKMKLRSHSKSSKSTKSDQMALNASKPDRAISFHWSNMDFESKTYLPVGKKDYGGDRKTRVKKTWMKQELILEAKDLYFDHQESTKGHEKLFQFDMAFDSKGKKLLPDNETVEEIITRTKIVNPRFYLLSKLTGIDDSKPCDDEQLPVMSTPKKRKSDIAIVTNDTSAKNQSQGLLGVEVSNSQESFSEEIAKYALEDLHPTFYQVVEQLREPVPGFSGERFSNDLIDTAAEMPLNVAESGDDEDLVRNRADESHRTADDSEVNNVMDTITLKCNVTRGTMFEDVIKFVVDEKINLYNQQIEVSVENERGEDSGGVLRDCLSEFWETFLLRYTTGSTGKIPVTVHTLQTNEWEAIAKVLVLGYKQEGYFPVLLAEVWIDHCINPEKPIDEGMLIETFMTRYLPDVDRSLLQEALDNFKEVDKSELIDLLGTYEGRVTANEENIWKVVNEIAHHQLIQKPSFVFECWSTVLSTHLQPLLLNSGLHKVYDDLKLDVRKVLKALSFSDIQCYEDKCTAESLKRYIKGCDDAKLELFVRFCTGSNLLVTSQIKVTITPRMSEISRRPIAHTCGSMLELSRSYSDFLTLREDMEKVLDSKVLVMDIL